MVKKTCKHELMYSYETKTHMYYKCSKCNFTQGRVLKSLLGVNNASN